MAPSRRQGRDAVDCPVEKGLSQPSTHVGDGRALRQAIQNKRIQGIILRSWPPDCRIFLPNCLYCLAYVLKMRMTGAPLGPAGFGEKTC